MGMPSIEELEVTRKTLEWIQQESQAREPYAVNFHHAIEEVIASLNDYE